MPSKPKKNYHAGHRERLREEAQVGGLSSLPDHRLLELLLFNVIPQRDTNPIAHELLERFGSLSGVLTARQSDLVKVPYIGENAALLFPTLMELYRRYQRDMAQVKVRLRSPADFAEAFRGRFEGLRREVIYMLCLTMRGELISVSKISEGTFNAAELNTRLVMEAVVAADASIVVLAHNHMSGELLPSQEDLATTAHLRDALLNVGVQLQDHLIFSEEKWISLAANGFYQPVF